MLRHLVFLAVVFALAASSATRDLHAQTAPSPAMLARFAKGMEKLKLAAEAAGGVQAIRGMTGVSFTARGDTYNDVQGFSAARIGRPERDGRLSVANDFDFAGARFSQRTQQELAGGFGLDTASLYRGGTAYAVRHTGREYVQTSNAPSPAASGGFVAIAARWCPPLLLQRALQNFRSVTWVEEITDASGTVDVIEFSFDETTRFRLHITQSDRRVARVQAISPDAVAGDDVSLVELRGAQVAGGIKFPTHFVGIRRGAPTFDMAVEGVVVNPNFVDALFLPPAGYRQVFDDKVTTTRINDRFYEVSGLGGGSYRSQFAVMQDFVVAFEAPLGVPATRQIIAEVRRVAGDKPIRYVVISHFHSDHAGGVGAYVDLGATVVSAAENKEALLSYARSRSLFLGLEGNRGDVQMSFLPVTKDGADIVDAGGHGLRVIDFQTPHVERLLALYDPQTRTIVNGDLFSRLVRWNKTFDVFARWLQRNETPVDLILGTHHEPITREDLLAVAKSARR